MVTARLVSPSVVDLSKKQWGGRSIEGAEGVECGEGVSVHSVGVSGSRIRGDRTAPATPIQLPGKLTTGIHGGWKNGVRPGRGSRSATAPGRGLAHHFLKTVDSFQFYKVSNDTNHASSEAMRLRRPTVPLAYNQSSDR